MIWPQPVFTSKLFILFNAVMWPNREWHSSPAAPWPMTERHILWNHWGVQAKYSISSVDLLRIVYTFESLDSLVPICPLMHSHHYNPTFPIFRPKGYFPYNPSWHYSRGNRIMTKAFNLPSSWCQIFTILILSYTDAPFIFQAWQFIMDKRQK